MSIEILPIDEIPLYNQDVENEGFPPSVVAIKKKVAKADGLIIATPEYNHGVPGVTKNVVDWASRPGNDSPLDGKPVGVIGASVGLTGGARGQSQLRQAFGFTNSYCMPKPEFLLSFARKKFGEDGKLHDEETRKFLRIWLEAFADWIRLFRE
jgi:chromate reductase